MNPRTYRVSEADLALLRAAPATATPGARWAAYSHDGADWRYLAVGPAQTYREPPDRFPDTVVLGLGWAHQFAGFVNLETGEILASGDAGLHNPAS